MSFHIVIPFVPKILLPHAIESKKEKEETKRNVSYKLILKYIMQKEIYINCNLLDKLYFWRDNKKYIYI